jgi:hypothetical protein
MTALAPREVERTFSGVRRFLAGLPGLEANQAGREDLGDFSNPAGRGANIHWDSHTRENDAQPSKPQSIQLLRANKGIWS